MQNSEGLPRGRGALPREQVIYVQRMRILDALVDAVAEHGHRKTSVQDVIARAGVSKSTFYSIFSTKQEAYLAAYEGTAALIRARLCRPGVSSEPWPRRVSVVLEELLALLDDDPAGARMLVLEAPAAGPSLLAARARALGDLQALLEAGRAVESPAADVPDGVTEAVIAGAHGLIEARLLDGSAEPLSDLLPTLIYIALAPYVGMQRALGELSRERPPRAAASSHRRGAGPGRLAWSLPLQSQRCLRYVQAHPNSSSQTVRRDLGFRHLSQVSRILAKLEGLGLTYTCHTPGRPHAWRPTPLGEEVLQALSRYSGDPDPVASG
jgi:AcrR family transcriptional regulator